MIKVGAATEVELKEKKHRIEDALSTTRAAVEEGLVAGGGTTLLQAIPALDKIKLEGDAQVGVDIVRKALEAPARQIADNAGAPGEVVVEHVKGLKPGHGYDALNGEYGDLFKKGIVDAAKVTRSALQNAASIAAMVLTTETLDHGHPGEGEGRRRRRPRPRRRGWTSSPPPAHERGPRHRRGPFSIRARYTRLCGYQGACDPNGPSDESVELEVTSGSMLDGWRLAALFGCLRRRFSLRLPRPEALLVGHTCRSAGLPLGPRLVGAVRVVPFQLVHAACPAIWTANAASSFVSAVDVSF